MNSILEHRRLGLFLCLMYAVLGVASDASAALSGLYKTAPGQTATYVYQPPGFPAVLLPLDVTMNFSGSPASLTATMHKPIIGARADGTPIFEIGGMVPITVMTTSTDDQHFMGNLHSQYFYDWTITPGSGGELLWNGTVGWAGGRIEQATITDARLVAIPEPTAMALFVSATALAFVGRPARRPRC